MADRRVRKTGKDSSREITKLCNDGEYWSPRSKADVINDIESKLHRYFVNEAGHESDIRVATTASGTKFLRTDADATSKNNLANLPDC